MDNLSFISDIWWNNTSQFIIDELGTQSSEHHRVCNRLNISGLSHVNLLTTSSGTNFQCMTNDLSIIPERIDVDVIVVSGYNNFNLDIKINDIEVFSETFPSGGPFVLDGGENVMSQSNTFIPNANELSQLIRYRHTDKNLPLHNLVQIIATPVSFSASGLDQKIRYIRIAYSGGSYDNSYNSPTPEIVSFYPSSLSGTDLVNSSDTDPSDASFVNGPTSSSSNDSSWISGLSLQTTNISGIKYNSDYIDFIFNTSGYFNPDNNTRKIDKCVFSIRYQNSSGDTSNNQKWSTAKLFVDEFDYNIGFGSGFLLSNQSGFARYETNIGFVDENSQTKYFATSDLMDEFTLRLYNRPKNGKVSSAQIDFYLSNDNMLPLHIPGEVHYCPQTQSFKSGGCDNPGYMRLKQQNFDDSVFNIVYAELSPFLSTPSWHHYYSKNANFNSYNGHNRYYKNALLSDGSATFIFNHAFDSNEDYCIMLQCSSSGNVNYLSGIYGSYLLRKQLSGLDEFALTIKNEEFEFITYNQDGVPIFNTFDSYANNWLVITKENDCGIDRLKVYISDTNSYFRNVVSICDTLRTGSGNIYICGSGTNNFVGYIHEYGIGSGYLDSDGIYDLYKSRSKINAVLLEGSGLELSHTQLSGSHFDVFRLDLNAYTDDEQFFQSNSSAFAYNNLVNPSSYLLTLNYENYGNDPDGTYFSGYYINTFSDNTENDDQSIILTFNENIPTGTSGTIEIPLENYQSPYFDMDNYSLCSSYIKLYIRSINETTVRYASDFRINSIQISFDGWCLPQTGIDGGLDSQVIDLYLDGFHVEDNNLDFFLKSQFYNSGLDFYIQGHAATNRSLDLFLKSAITIESGLDFYTPGGEVAYDDFPIYLHGPQVVAAGINFYTFGTIPVPDSGNLPFITYSSTVSGLYNTVQLFTFADLDPERNVDLYIKSEMDETEDSINLFIDGDQQGYAKFNMYVMNLSSGVDYELNFFCPSAYSDSGNLNMYLES